jgi:hypothetical protein
MNRLAFPGGLLLQRILDELERRQANSVERQVIGSADVTNRDGGHAHGFEGPESGLKGGASRVAALKTTFCRDGNGRLEIRLPRSLGNGLPNSGLATAKSFSRGGAELTIRRAPSSPRPAHPARKQDWDTTVRQPPGRPHRSGFDGLKNISSPYITGSACRPL